MASFARHLPLGRYTAASGTYAGGIVGLLFTWQERARQRTHLREVLEGDEVHRLSDMGIDRASAEREADKFFWRA